MSPEKKILIIGLGEIGYNNAEYMMKLGVRPDGFDVSKDAVNRALRSGVIKDEAKNLAGYDYYLICISTHNPHDMFQPKMGGLYELAERIADEGKSGALVAVESTVIMGTSQKVKDIIGHRLHVSHVPHRYYGLEKERHGVKQLRVLGGCEKCCTEEARLFYGYLLRIPLYTVKSIEYAELCKIIENTERFLRISFAEELSIVCDGYDLSFQELRDAVNTKWNVEVLEAKQGIGGHCLPKDSQMYIDLARKIITESLLNAAKSVDVDYRRFLAQNRTPLRLEQPSTVAESKVSSLTKLAEKGSE